MAENPHKWTSKYGSLVLSAYDSGTHEGVNEMGLSAHALDLAEACVYGKRDPKLEAIGVMQCVQYFSVIRDVSVPFALGDPAKPNVASTIFRTVQDLTGGRYYFESTYAPNVVWGDITKLDFTAGRPEMELQVEKKIFALNGDVTSQLVPAKPFVFGKNQR